MAELLLAASVARQGSSAPDEYFDDEEFEQKKDDNRIKLKRAAGAPTDVYSWFEITLQEINLPQQTFKAVIEVHLFWQDYYLPELIEEEQYSDFSIHDDYVPVKMSEIFENKVDCSNSDPEFKYFKDTGTVYMMFVVDCTFVERMELQRFPLDRQFLNMEFNAMISPVIEEEGNWNWILEFPDWMPQELKKYDQSFAVRMLSSITEYELLDPWVDFSTQQPLTIRLRVNRLPAYYFGNIIFPNFLIVAGCFSAFVIPRGDIADRLSVTVTLMLAAVAYRFIVSQMLPKVSYLTFMDYYILLGFVSVMVLIAENAIAGVPSLDKYGAQIDLWCAVIFGAMWFIVHIIALIALLRNECLRVSWQEMDAIDQAEDDEAEFIFAETKYVSGNNETESGKSDWKKYKNFNVMDRANMYAKANHIKRSTTFVKKLKAEKTKQNSQNLGKIYEEELQKEKEKEKEKINTETNAENNVDGEENIDIYVPSKLKKVEPAKSQNQTENQMSSSIELAEQKNTQEPKYEQHKIQTKIENKTEAEAENAENVPEKEQKEDELINKNTTDHGYTETVVINNNVKDDENDENDEDENGSDKDTTPLNQQKNDEYVKVDNSGYTD